MIESKKKNNNNSKWSHYISSIKTNMLMISITEALAQKEN